MTHGRVLWAASLILASVAGGRRAAAQTLTLEEVEQRAQRDRPELVERQASIDKARADLAGVVAKGRPTLGARGDFSLAPGGHLVRILGDDGEDYLVQGAQTIDVPGASVPTPRYAAMLSGKWTILDFGRTALGVRAGEAVISAGRASLLQAKIELVRSARTAYLAWVEAHQTWQLSHQDAEVTSSRTNSVRALIQEGVRPATDATLSAYDEQIAKLREARARRASSMALEALGAAISGELAPTSEPDLKVLEAAPIAAAATPDGTPAGSPASAPPARAAADPALHALDLQRQGALAAARAADRSHAPQLDAIAELGIQGQDAEIFPAYRAALSLSVPLFDGGAQSALAEQHRAEARGLDAQRQLIEQKLRVQQNGAQLALRAAGEELAMSLELLATAEAMLSEAEDHYKSGSDTLERVLSAQRSLLQARREVLTAKLDNARARLELVPVPVEP
jgi:outer membrane protein